MVDKIIYTKTLGKNIINIVLNYASNTLYIVVATPIGNSEFAGKRVGNTFKIEDEEKAIQLVNNIHDKWLTIYRNIEKNVHVDLNGNLKSLALSSSKSFCYN